MLYEHMKHPFAAVKTVSLLRCISVALGYAFLLYDRFNSAIFTPKRREEIRGYAVQSGKAENGSYARSIAERYGLVSEA